MSATQGITASAEGSGGRASGRDALAFLLVWLPYALLVRRFWWLCDDAYISFRYARNWAEGLGLRYNPGASPPAEGYSNFAFVALGALLERLGAALEFWMPAVAALSGTLLLWLVFRALRGALGLDRVAAALVALALALSAQLAVWSTSGLETLTYTLLLFATFQRLVLRAEGPDGLGGGLLALALALTRVEGVAWAVVLLALAVASRRARGQACLRPALVYGGLVLLGWGGWFAWKSGYYGHALAATVHAKVGLSGERLARGLDYVLVQHLSSLSLWVAVPGTLAAARRGRRAVGLPAAAVAWGSVAFAVAVSGDFMAFGRFLVPALPFHALLLGFVVQDLAQLWRGATLSVPLAVAALALLPGFDLHPVPRGVRAALHFRRRTPDYRSEHAQWWQMRQNAIDWAVRGDALGRLAAPGDSVVAGMIGALGYRSRLFVFDRHGLVSPEVALRERDSPERELRSPGHDEPVDERWFLERGHAPTFLRPVLEFAQGPEPLLRAAQRSRRRLRQELGDSPYRLEVHRLPWDDPDRGAAHLFVWRRHGSPAEAQRAERALDEDLARLAAGGALPALDMPAPDGGVAGVPRWW